MENIPHVQNNANSFNTTNSMGGLVLFTPLHPWGELHWCRQRPTALLIWCLELERCWKYTWVPGSSRTAPRIWRHIIRNYQKWWVFSLCYMVFMLPCLQWECSYHAQIYRMPWKFHLEPKTTYTPRWVIPQLGNPWENSPFFFRLGHSFNGKVLQSLPAGTFI